MFHCYLVIAQLDEESQSFRHNHGYVALSLIVPVHPFSGDNFIKYNFVTFTNLLDLTLLFLLQLLHFTNSTFYFDSLQFTLLHFTSIHFALTDTMDRRYFTLAVAVVTMTFFFVFVSRLVINLIRLKCLWHEKSCAIFIS